MESIINAVQQLPYKFVSVGEVKIAGVGDYVIVALKEGADKYEHWQALSETFSGDRLFWHSDTEIAIAPDRRSADYYRQWQAKSAK